MRCYFENKKETALGKLKAAELFNDTIAVPIVDRIFEDNFKLTDDNFMIYSKDKRYDPLCSDKLKDTLKLMKMFKTTVGYFSHFSIIETRYDVKDKEIASVINFKFPYFKEILNIVDIIHCISEDKSKEKYIVFGEEIDEYGDTVNTQITINEDIAKKYNTTVDQLVLMVFLGIKKRENPPKEIIDNLGADYEHEATLL